MANITPNFIRGFLVPFKMTADNFFADESTLTQNGSLAGIPVSQNNSPLVLTSKGTQDRDIEIKTHRPGHIQDGAGFVWRYDGDSNYYGHETPNKVMDVRTIQAGQGSTRFTPRDALRLESGVVLVTVEKVDANSVNRTKIYRLDVDGSVTDIEIDAVNFVTLSNKDRFPTLCQLPDGSVNLAMWTVDIYQEIANIVIYQSTDDGETWSKVSSKALDDEYIFDVSGTFGAGADGVELSNIVMASSQHQVMLLASYKLHDTDPALGSVVNQYGSSNNGLTFKYVDKSEEADGTQFYLPKVLQFNGVFIVGYIARIDQIRFTRLSNVFDSIFDTVDLIGADVLDGDVCDYTANRLIDGDWTMTMDTDGRMYLYVAQTDKTIIHGAYSDLMGVSVEDYGETWNLYGDETNFDDTNVLNFQSPTSSNSGGYKNIVATCGQGENLLFGNWENNGTHANADGVHIITLGGWSTQQYGKLNPYPNDNQWGCDTHSWCPFDLPGQGLIWAKSGSGTEVLDGDHVSLAATNNDVIWYVQGLYDKTNGITLHTRVSNVSGGTSTEGTAIGTIIQQRVGTQIYWLEIILGSNSIYVYDANTSTLVGSATALGLQSGIQILAHVDNTNGDVDVYFGDAGSPRQYQRITGSLSLAATANQAVYWGIKSTNGAVKYRRADFHFFSYAVGDDVGIWDNGVINSKRYSSQGFDTQIKDGLTISTIDGPAREGDEYTLTPQFGSPIQRTLHIVSPSPRVGWRSDSVTNPDNEAVDDQLIAWTKIPNVLEELSFNETNTIGVHFTNVNFKTFVIQYHNGITWVDYQTIQNTVGGVRGIGNAGFEFERSGASIFSNEAAGPYLHLNECHRWSILLDDGEEVVQRRIQSNGDGVLSGNDNNKRAYLTIEGYKSTDPYEGTAYLIPSSVTVLINRSSLSGLRFNIQSQKTAEGYFEIGTMVAGPLIIAGPQYGRGRTIQIESNVIENEAPNGTLYTSSRGQDGRVVRIAWTDGVDTSDLYANEANPNHYELYNNQPIAVRGSAPTAMMGLIQYVKSSQNAIVYLPNIAINPEGALVLNRYHNQILTTMGTEIQIDHVIGGELLDNNMGEVFRVSTVLLREVR
jgi:hypothetical protein